MKSNWEGAEVGETLSFQRIERKPVFSGIKEKSKGNVSREVPRDEFLYES